MTLSLPRVSCSGIRLKAEQVLRSDILRFLKRTIEQAHIPKAEGRRLGRGGGFDFALGRSRFETIGADHQCGDQRRGKGEKAKI